MTAMWLSLAFSVTCTTNLQTPLLFTLLIGLCSNIHGQTLCKGMSGSSVFTLSAEIFNCHVHWHSHAVIPDRHLCRSRWQWAGHWSDHEPLLRGRSLTPSPLFQRVEANVLCLRPSSGAAILLSAIQWPQGTASSAISSLAVLPQLHLPWPDALCQMALNTSAKICNAKSTNGHVSNVPMQSQPMAYVQCPSSTQNKTMVSLKSAHALQSQAMGTVQCANVK